MDAADAGLKKKYVVATVLSLAGIALAAVELATGPYFRFPPSEWDDAIYYDGPISRWAMQWVIVTFLALIPLFVFSVKRLATRDFERRDASRIGRDFRRWRTPGANLVLGLPVLATVVHWIETFLGSWTAPSVDWYQGWALAVHVPWLIVVPLFGIAVSQRLQYGEPPPRPKKRGRGAPLDRG